MMEKLPKVRRKKMNKKLLAVLSVWILVEVASIATFPEKFLTVLSVFIIVPALLYFFCWLFAKVVIPFLFFPKEECNLCGAESRWVKVIPETGRVACPKCFSERTSEIPVSD